MSGITDGILTTQRPLLGINVGLPANPYQIFGPPNSNTEVRFKKSGLISHRSGPVLDSVNIGRPTTAADITERWDNQIEDDNGYFDQSITLPPALLYPERKVICVNPTAARIYAFPTATDLIEGLKGVYGADNIYAGMAWEINWINRSTVAAASVSLNTNTGITFMRGDRVIHSLEDAQVTTPGVPSSKTSLIVLNSVNPANYLYDVYLY